MSLVGKARARPDQVRRVVESISQQGVSATYRKVMNRLDSFTPLGYSLSGTVIESMEPELPVGTRVACGGNEYALHAEFNYVPRNLCTVVPDGVKSEHAAFTTVGSIAMQAFRRSEATIGETVCVIGLGLIGQLVVQIAHAAGVNVFGLDPSEERCSLAERSGARAAGAPTGPSAARVRERLLELTDGHGADVVFLAAATDSDQPVNMAVDIARDRARVVDVGKLPLDLPWKPYYEKEIDVRFSRSYGPGRYDPTYEEDGVDYPIGYVRWTEQRNMRSFLDLVASGRIDLEVLIHEIVPFDSSVEAYERLLSGESRAIGSLFAYAQETSVQRIIDLGGRAETAPKPGIVGLGVIGSGNYASTMLLPHLASNPDVNLSVVATATALSGATAHQKFGFDRITSDYLTLIDDDDVDAVVIATRHDLHAEMVSRFIEAGKAVFVEKPLAVTMDELDRVVESMRSSGNDRLMVGFNRRFAPLLRKLREAWGDAPGEQHLHYLVNAGPVESDSWYRDTSRYGSRFVGEGGHFVDVLSWWLGERPAELVAFHSPGDMDDLEVTLRFPSGSIGVVSYLTRGSRRYPKETFLASGGSRTARLDNFDEGAVWSDRGKKEIRSRGKVDKGQAAQMTAFVEAVKTGSAMPISIDDLISTTEATLLTEVSASSGRVETTSRFPGV
jgi:predicted dehydrogenase/threonine dehydrogenase-like Zn-dependent dehydrogenase